MDLLLAPLLYLMSLVVPPAPSPAPAITVLPSAGEALRVLVDQTHPSVLGMGEVHQTTKKMNVRSALSRFGDELLPLLAPVSSDLVLETWMVTGQCGEPEKQVAKDVEKTTERPAQTEDEIITVAKRAKAANVAPHALEIDCHDYATVTAGGEVDYEKLLGLTRDRLQQAVVRALSGPRRAGRPLVMVYGGALHNDVNPQADAEAIAYGPGVYTASGGGYVELDLYVPEIIKGTGMEALDPWLKVVKQKPGQVLLVRRSPASYVIVFAPSAKGGKSGKSR